MPLHEAYDRKNLVLSLHEFKPQVVFIDHSDKHFGPTSLLCRIIRAAPASHIVVFVKEPDQPEAAVFAKAGAKGYSRRNISGQLLRKAAHLVAGGQAWFSRKTTAALIDELARSESISPTSPQFNQNAVNPTGLKSLSPREREIASLVGGGEHNKTISHQLQISEKTVKAHLTSIFRKLDVEGRTQLALLANQTLTSQAKRTGQN